jgi:hypothetical protein
MNGQWLVVENFVLDHSPLTFCFILFWELILNPNVKHVENKNSFPTAVILGTFA